MHPPGARRYTFIVILGITLLSIFFPGGVQGSPFTVSLERPEPQRLNLTVGKSVIVSTSGPVKRVSIGAQEIADTVVLTPRQVSVIGKVPGITNLTLWGPDDKISTILDIQVCPDVSRLQEMIGKIFPEEKNLQIDATHDSLTLSGTVLIASNLPQILALSEPFFPKKVVNLLKVKLSSDVANSSDLSKVKQAQLKELLHKVLPEEKDIRLVASDRVITLSGRVTNASVLSQVLAVTEAHLPKEGKVVNLLEVAGVQQVMLEVRVAEVSRSLIRRLGFNFNQMSGPGGNLGLSLLNNLTRLPQNRLPSFSPPAALDVADPINGILRFMSGGSGFTIFIDALKEQGLLKVLAEPTLITLSGRSASFLAGGEFPIPVPQPGAGGVAITIEYKPFGVGLNFTPTVLSNEKISMQVAPEVSELDFSHAITISGFVIPAVTTRRVSTVVELGDGQSFAIAGLLKDDIRQIVSKFPVLGEIPVLGALFRSSSFQKNETELIIIVTPRLVKPLDMASKTLPTDQYIEPDDFEFYLRGSMEGKGKANSNSGKAENRTRRLEGEFGHIVPR